MKSVALALVIGLLAICSPFVAGAQAASLQDLGEAPGSNALGTGGVSANGNVVTGELFGGGPVQAFSWFNGTVTPLGFLGSDGNSRGTAANTDGSVIAGYSFSSTQTAFRWTGGTLSGIGALADSTCSSGHALPSSMATAINADGSVIVGQSASNAFCNGEAFRWVGGTMTGLGCPTLPVACFQNSASGVSADGSVVVGTALESGSLSGGAWRWVGGAYNVFLGPGNNISANANAVTPDGTIVVGGVVPGLSMTSQAYIWNSTTNAFTYLGQLPGGNSSVATAVSADGSVVVGYGYDSTEHQQGWIWTAANGMRPLNAVLTALNVNVSGWALSAPTGISADGTVVVGSGTGPCNCSAGWIVYLGEGPSLTATPTSGPAPLAVSFSTGLLSVASVPYSVTFGDGANGALTQGQCVGVSVVVSRQGGVACYYSTSHIYSQTGAYSATLLNSNNAALASANITVTSSSPEGSRIYPFGGAAPPNATTFESQSIGAMQDGPGQAREVPFTGSNATVPTISSFTASPASLSPFDAGESATLSWSAASATSLSISGIGAVTGTSVQVSPSQTTIYTLTAANAQGLVTAQTTVTVAGYRTRRKND